MLFGKNTRTTREFGKKLTGDALSFGKKKTVQIITNRLNDAINDKFKILEK